MSVCGTHDDEERQRDRGAGPVAAVDEAADESVEHDFEDRHRGRGLLGVEDLHAAEDCGCLSRANDAPSLTCSPPPAYRTIMKRRLAGLAFLLLVGVAVQAWARASSRVTFSVGGATVAKFCTRNGNIQIQLSATRPMPDQSCSIGGTHIEGPSGTYDLKTGPAHITPGCYSQSIAGTTCSGGAVATSVINYDL
jgi:hypothetical protein